MNELNARQLQPGDVAALEALALPVRDAVEEGRGVSKRLKAKQWRVDFPVDVSSGSLQALRFRDPPFSFVEGVPNRTVTTFVTTNPEAVLSVLLKRKVGRDEVNAASFVRPDFVLGFGFLDGVKKGKGGDKGKRGDRGGSGSGRRVAHARVEAVQAGDSALASRLMLEMEAAGSVRLTAGLQVKRDYRSSIITRQRTSPPLHTHAQTYLSLSLASNLSPPCCD